MVTTVHDDAARELASVRGDSLIPGELVMYLSNNNGQVYVTDEVQAFIDSVGNNPYNFIFPAGTYKLGPILIRYNRQNIVGANGYGVRLDFVPTAHDQALFTFAQDSGATAIDHCGAHNLLIRSSDTTFRKIAFDLYDVSDFLFDRVTVGTQSAFIGGGASIGVRASGREFLKIRDSQFWVNDGTPIHIRNNSHVGIGIDQDYLTIDNVILSGDMTNPTTKPLIKLDAGVQITRSSITDVNMSFGGAGIEFIDGISTTSSDSLTIDRVHWEQSKSANGVGWWLKIDRTGSTALNHLTIRDCGSGGDLLTNGVFLANVNSASLEHYAFNNTGETALSVTAVRNLTLQNCFEQDGSTRVMTNMQPVVQFGRHDITAIDSYTFEAWESTANTNAFQSVVIGGAVFFPRKGTLAAGANTSIVTAGMQNGIMRLSASGATLSCGGVFIITKHTAALLGTGLNVDDASTGGNLCILWASPTSITLLNNTAESLDYLYDWEFRTA